MPYYPFYPLKDPEFQNRPREALLPAALAATLVFTTIYTHTPQPQDPQDMYTDILLGSISGVNCYVQGPTPPYRPLPSSDPSSLEADLQSALPRAQQAAVAMGAAAMVNITCNALTGSDSISRTETLDMNVALIRTQRQGEATSYDWGTTDFVVHAQRRDTAADELLGVVILGHLPS
jgi:hypothetical protein